MMKRPKYIVCLAVCTLLIGMAACSSATSYRDGVYTAQLDEFSSSGWKDTLELTVDGGEITKVNWDAIYVDDSIPIRKKQYSKSGLYGMLAAGAVGEWYDQATAAEQYVLKNGPAALVPDSDGYTDVISGCTIHVSDFEKLLLDCLKQAE
ncbi:MAG: FMN-binding protein [Clostridiales Family XIII bacterium]|jgi:major membrane immunogen (membrane-anchored lipoprotein)|nr:FMN-binding protein [Clostridiales Family XIII bacterium]